MAISDLVAQVREDILDDTVAPYLWSDAALTRYANEAVSEACKRAPLINRSSTIAVVVGTPTYLLDSSVKQVTLVITGATQSPLTQTTTAELDAFVGVHWRDQEGTPTHFIKQAHKLTLYPKPVATDSLLITSINTPDDDFDLDDDIDSSLHHGLMYYIAYKAYLKHDADTYNPERAAEHLALFDRYFGMQKSVRLQTIQSDMPLYQTLAGGRLC